jgi:electron transfer flavoprotein beta subunit
VSPRAVKNGVTPDSHEYQEGPRYASLKGIMAAKKKPLDTRSLADLAVTAAPQVKELSVDLPPPRAAGRKVADVAELVRLLRDEAKAL